MMFFLGGIKRLRGGNDGSSPAASGLLAKEGYTGKSFSRFDKYSEDFSEVMKEIRKELDI